ncbi:MAG: hypothetical protein CMF42_01035 [Legionellales bacterium]|nr:hypothetical protein [Legionellales bacterium]|tara:strand:+ start:6714 stop:7871 length:1158 start_codon:yes stop_codon:yes gene_type:complete
MIQEALGNIRLHFLRTLFAIFGVTIGTAAFVALTNLGMIFQKVLDDQFSHLGTNIHYFNLNYQNNSTNIQLDDLLKIQNQQVKSITPLATKHSYYRLPNEKKVNLSVIGIIPEKRNVLNYQLLSGRDFIPTDTNTCLISESLIQQFSKNNVPLKIGDDIPIDDHFYTIIGITKTQAEGFQGYFIGNPNRQIVVPISNSLSTLYGINIDRLIVEFSSRDHLEDKTALLKKQLKDISPSLDIYVQSLNDIYAASQGIASSFNLFLLMIGIISLLVGGIGIMNIMYIAVMERRKEIGLRMAIGAQPHNILLLFLCESILICLIGGLIGIVLSIPFTMIFCNLVHQKFYLFFTPMIIGVMIPFLIGLFFGAYPAWKASKLHPVKALSDI